MVKELLKFLDDSPTAFQAVSSIKDILLKNNYEELKEDNFKVDKGKKYFISRNDSSIIAFNIGKKLNNPSLHICASHTDCPSLKLKPNAVINEAGYSRLNVEIYGGPLIQTWFDRPLGIAGRVFIKDKKSIKSIIFNHKEAIGIIPSVAPHIKKQDDKLNPQIDLLPFVSLDDKFNLESFLSKQLKVKKEDILSFDLYLIPSDRATLWGEKKEFFTSSHIDNLECAYTSLIGFINNFNDDNINIYISFDNEEVGSLTRQGADSNFFEITLRRICEQLKIDYYDLMARGMMLSCDNGHGRHPNHRELADQTNAPVLNGGVVIKYNANQSYTSDGAGIALLKKLMDDHKIPYQVYTNRSDQRGGSTLGNLSNRHVSVLTIDIGLAMLAMHSINETAGSKDVDHMIKLIKQFYKGHYHMLDNNYHL